MGTRVEFPHKPVMLKEVCRYLPHRAEGVYVDGTAGNGGHSLAIGKRLKGNGRLICLDLDSEAVILAKKRLDSLGDRVQVIKANFADLDKVLSELGYGKVDGILLDLGMSSSHLENSGRGFSFRKEEPLDMRMDPNAKTTAYDLVNHLSQEALERVLKEYGEERRAKRISKAIVRIRKDRPIETSAQLAALIESVLPPSQKTAARHPGTRSFQAIRIAVNRELDNLEGFLGNAPKFISEGGRLVTIAYHSLEDRMIKKSMGLWEQGCTCPRDFPQCVCGQKPLFNRLSKRGLRPGKDEVKANPRARSAMLRAAERIS